MRIWTIWGVAALLAVWLKLFTYEFYLNDDPTSGVALRSRPGVSNMQLLVQSDKVLLSDENRFVGAGMYQAAVGWGYLLVLAAGPVLLVWRRMRR